MKPKQHYCGMTIYISSLTGTDEGNGLQPTVLHFCYLSIFDTTYGNPMQSIILQFQRWEPHGKNVTVTVSYRRSTCIINQNT